MIAPREAKPEGGGKKGWICVCKLQNFANRTNCFKCGAERAENAEECTNKPREPKEDSMNNINWLFLFKIIF